MARVITAPGIVRNVSKYLNSMRRVPFAIGKDDWTEVDSSTYTYEFVTAYITTSSFDIGTFDKSILSYAEGDISMEKKDGGGGMVFTTTKRPTGTVSGSIYIWDNNDNKVPVILEDTVVPIENGGTGATSVLGILSNLGLGSANDAQETLDFGDAVHKDVANNVTTTSEGYVLDARQGKVLKDSVDALNSKVTDGYRGIAYLVGTTNGSTAIPAGSFVYVNNNGNGIADGLYTANEAIGAYYQITTSRVTAVPDGGGLNALNSKTIKSENIDSGSATKTTSLAGDHAYSFVQFVALTSSAQKAMTITRATNTSVVHDFGSGTSASLKITNAATGAVTVTVSGTLTWMIVGYYMG